MEVIRRKRILGAFIRGALYDAAESLLEIRIGGIRAGLGIAG